MKVLDIAVNDLLRSLRSLFAIGMMVVAPISITALIYFAFAGFGGETPDLPAVTVGVVNADDLPDGAALDASLGESIRSMFFDESVESWIKAGDYTSEAEIRAALNVREIGVAVLLPAGLTEALLAGEPLPTIQILHDPTLSITPAIVRDMVQSVLDGVTGGGIAIETLRVQQTLSGEPFDPAQIPTVIGDYQTWYIEFQRALFHDPSRAALTQVNSAVADSTTTTNPIQGLIGGVMAGQMIFFAFYTGAYSMLTIVRDEENGTLPRLFTTPTARTTILLGKYLAVVLTVALQGLFLMLFATLAFGVRWGAPGPVVMALTGQVVAATGLGVLLIAFVKTSQQAGPVLGGGLTALGMLGGLFTVAIPNLPAWLTAAALYTPQGWVLRGWQLALAGHGPTDLLWPLGVLVAMGLGMFAIGAVLFQRRFA